MRKPSTVSIATGIALLMLLLLSAAPGLLAQNESGTRTISESGFRGLGFWFDASRLTYGERHPIIRSLPPVNSGMPENVLRAYIYLDSLMRFDKDHNTEMGIGSSVTDNLKGLLKRFYEVVDYDPLTFAQYRTEVSLKRGVKYATNLQGLYNKAREVVKRNSVVDNAMKSIHSALYPDYVIRIKVVAIDSMLDAQSMSNEETYRYRVTAKVIETLKGQMLPVCTEESLPEASPCIRFQYGPRNYFNPNDYQSEGVKLYTKRDPEFMTADGYFTMREGQEAVVFLSYYQTMFDASADYLDLNLEMQASFNALPIIDGAVRDINRIWSSSETIPYDHWKMLFNAARQKIADVGY